MPRMCSQTKECVIKVNSYFVWPQTIENTNKRRNKKFDIDLFVFCEVESNFVAVQIFLVVKGTVLVVECLNTYSDSPAHWVRTPEYYAYSIKTRIFNFQNAH